MIINSSNKISFKNTWLRAPLLLLFIFTSSIGIAANNLTIDGDCDNFNTAYLNDTFVKDLCDNATSDTCSDDKFKNKGCDYVKCYLVMNRAIDRTAYCKRPNLPQEFSTYYKQQRKDKIRVTVDTAKICKEGFNFSGKKCVAN